MKNIKCFFIICFFLGIVSNGFSQQTMSDYSYVVIPEQYEFLKGKDKYQLNSLTKFLFNKYGFHAFFNEDAPNVKRCDGLWVAVEKASGFLNTVMIIVVKDCNNNEVYRTKKGKSRYKEYKKAYQEALRNAFDEIIELDVNQKEISVQEETKPVQEETKPISEKPLTKPVENVESTLTIAEKPTKPAINIYKIESVPVETIKPSYLPATKFSSYTYQGKTFLLRKTNEGYSFYEESSVTENGLLLKGKIEAMNATKLYFTDVSENIFKVSFDASQNLIIQKGATFQKYKRVE